MKKVIMMGILFSQLFGCQVIYPSKSVTSREFMDKYYSYQDISDYWEYKGCFMGKQWMAHYKINVDISVPTLREYMYAKNDVSFKDFPTRKQLFGDMYQPVPAQPIPPPTPPPEKTPETGNKTPSSQQPSSDNPK